MKITIDDSELAGDTNLIKELDALDNPGDLTVTVTIKRGAGKGAKSVAITGAVAGFVRPREDGPVELTAKIDKATRSTVIERNTKLDS